MKEKRGGLRRDSWQIPILKDKNRKGNKEEDVERVTELVLESHGKMQCGEASNTPKSIVFSRKQILKSGGKRKAIVCEKEKAANGKSSPWYIGSETECEVEEMGVFFRLDDYLVSVGKGRYLMEIDLCKER